MSNATARRNGLAVTNSIYTHMIEVDGEWWLTGNTRYCDKRLEDAKFEVAEGAVEDFDLLASAPLYVRLGGLPEGGRSRNYRDGGYEAGVSAFRAAWDGGTLVVDANAGAALFGSDRPLYEIAGQLLDCEGSDGEPIIFGAKIVREIDRNAVRFAR